MGVTSTPPLATATNIAPAPLKDAYSADEGLHRHMAAMGEVPVVVHRRAAAVMRPRATAATMPTMPVLRQIRLSFEVVELLTDFDNETSHAASMRALSSVCTEWMGCATCSGRRWH